MRKQISILAFALAMLAVCVMLPSREVPAVHAQAIATNIPVDPCFSNTIKSFAAISIGSATTTAVVATSAGKAIFVCQFDMTIGGTTATAQFKSGTQTTTPCDTGAANLTGVYAPTSGNEVSAQGFGMVFNTPVGSQLCITSAGTGPSLQGVVTYIQQ